MAGHRTLVTEVFRGAHQPSAKEHLPVAVHRNPSGERMIRVGDRAGEIEPVQALLIGRLCVFTCLSV